jgi:hypothetical protein
MLALAIGVLMGSLIAPRPAMAQGAAAAAGGQGRTARYAFVTGIAGIQARSETLYVVDDANELLFVFEYSGSSHKCEFKTAKDLRRDARDLMKLRAQVEKGGAK